MESFKPLEAEAREAKEIMELGHHSVWLKTDSLAPIFPPPIPPLFPPLQRITEWPGLKRTSKRPQNPSKDLKPLPWAGLPATRAG